MFNDANDVDFSGRIDVVNACKLNWTDKDI